jgi:lisH domain-containing protein FOPNL
MEGVSDLKQVIRQALENKGILQQIKAQIRAEVFLSLEGNHATESMGREPVEKPPEIFLACELIRELLMSLNYKNSLAVFCEESGPTAEMLIQKEYLASELGLTLSKEDQNVPLLLLIVKMLKDMKAQRIDEEILTS